MSLPTQEQQCRRHRQRAFTLIELLLVIGIIAILATIVILAVNPQRQLLSARDADRNSGAKQLANALTQLSIEKTLVNNAAVPTGVGAAKPVCKATYSDATCVNVDDVAPTYIATLPIDAREPCQNYIGYKVYKKTNGFGVLPMRLGANDNGFCLWSGLIGYWKMEEGTEGSTVIDYSAGGVNGTMNGNAGVLPQPSTQIPSSLTGVDERSLNFNVLSGQYVTFGNTNTDYPNFTVALWAKAATNNPADPLYPIHVTNLIGKGDWNTSNNWYIGFYSLGGSAATNISFVYGIRWSVGPQASLSTLDISQWHHYAGVASPTQEMLYIDGKLASTVNTAHASVTNAFELQIARSSYASRFFSGNIDDVRLYNRALSSDEIKALATGSLD